MLKHILAALLFMHPCNAFADELQPELRVGRAGHAFDHVGGINEQAQTAAASGATIIYASGIGAWGYEGLPPAAELAAQCDVIADYNRDAKAKGIELAIAYLCATSIVKLDSFDKNWSAEFRDHFGSPPAEWRQMDRRGEPLASWYGGEYQPACMSNPDWRIYQRLMVERQLRAGHDGIFFDNPTVHPQGCYCRYCMEKFAAYLTQAGVAAPADTTEAGIDAIRKLADAHPDEFLQFRSTIASDFVSEMRRFARTIYPRALVTCNNSLNTPDRLFAQCRVHGYNINELSKVEDFVLVEDMVSQPCIDASGQTTEFGPIYKQLHAIGHGKPIVAVTLVNSDYHTAPNLVRLAMAEAAANGASYLSWPTWPEDQRERMIAAIRPQANLLRRNEKLLNDASFRADVVLFLPFRRWTESDHCAATNLAAQLSRANVQYEIMSEDNFNLSRTTKHRPVLLVESLAALSVTESAAVRQFQIEGGRVVVADNDSWLDEIHKAIERPSLVLKELPNIRTVVRDQPSRTIVHLLNLNVQRLSSFEDDVMPASEVELTVIVPFNSVRSVTLQTADEGGTSGPLEFTTLSTGEELAVKILIPNLVVNAIVVIEP